MATADTTQPLPEEITSSLAAVWKRYTEKRPESASTEIKGNIVRCVMPASVKDFESGAETDEGEEADPAGRLVNFRRDASRAVAKTTHCRVLAMICEHDAKTDVATQIFVLEMAPKGAPFGEPGWIVS